MTSIERDEQGFLVGDRMGSDEIIGQLGSIHDELKAIRAALGASPAGAPRAMAPAREAEAPAATPAGRRNEPRSQAAREAGPSTASTPASVARESKTLPVAVAASTAGAVVAAKRQAQVAEKAVRDRSGRFIGRGEREGLTGERSTDNDGEGGSLSRAISGVGERVAGAVAELGAGTEEADPSVKAFNEIAQPLTRGFGKIFGGGDSGDRKQDRWYRRFWRQMTLQGRNDKAADEDTQRALKGVERAISEDDEGGGGILGGIGGLLMKLPGMSLLVPAISSLLGFIRPLGGLVGKLALPVAAIFSAVKSFGTSTEEYAARMGVELNGSLAQALGVRFAGVLGDLGNTLTFGLAGKFGELIAPHVATAFETIGATWTTAVETIKGAGESITAAWDQTLGWFQDGWDGVFGKIGEWVDGITGFGRDTKETIIKTTERVVEKAGDVKEGVSSWIADKTDRVASAMGGGSKARKEALQVEMANAGITDPREQAMFMAQMDHESGGFKASEESFKYRSAEQVMATSASARKRGKPAIEAAMKQGPEALAELMYGGRMGNTEKGDAHKFRGRGAIQLTGKDNYAAASKDLGIDLVSNPDMAADPEVAARVATWYWKKNNIGEAARKGDVTAVTKRINGGTNGLADRSSKYRGYLAASTTGTVSLGKDGVASRSVSPTAVPHATEAPPLPLAQDASLLARAGAAAPPAPAAVSPVDYQALADARELEEAVQRGKAARTAMAAQGVEQGGVVQLPMPARTVAPVNSPASGVLPMQATSVTPAAMANAPSVPSVRTASMASIPEAPTIPAPMASDSGSSSAPQSRPAEVSRDVPDRRIAHVVTGAYSGMY